MKFSVNLETVYRGIDPLAALADIHRLGFKAFEFWSWGNKDLPAIKKKMAELDLTLAAMTPHVAPNLVDHRKRPEFIDQLQQTIEAAHTLQCRTVIITVGQALEQVSRETQHEHVIESLRSCQEMIQDAGITLVVEPLNTLIDHPGYFLTFSEEAFQIIDQVNSANVKVLYDVYHQQISEGNIIPTIQKYHQQIGHIHTASHPGRHELHLGEIHYDNVFKSLQDIGYTDYIGLEYYPTTAAEEGLRLLIERWPQ